MHAFATRKLGDDVPLISGMFGIEKIFTLKQIHSNKGVIPERDGPWDKPPEADLIITAKTNVGIGIRTADCVPILAYDPVKHVIAAIHAGWKGVIAGVVESALFEMRQYFRSSCSSLVVALGTSLCPGCFEVGPETAEEFRRKFGPALVISKGEGDRYFLDLREACRILLEKSGVTDIEFLPYCTNCREDLFYSYRRGDTVARMLSFIALLPQQPSAGF